MTVSIVVPAFNEEKLLGRTLSAIRQAAEAFAERGWDWELVVCDNNSTDRTAAIAREQGAKVVFEPLNQIARARNTGAAAARGDWLLFIDADSEPDRALFAEASGLIARGDVLAAGSTVRMDGELGRVGTGLLAVWNWLSRTLRWLAGSFVLVEASAFREVGGFNTAFYAGEEIDLSRRLKRLARRRGRRIAIISNQALRSSPRRMLLYSRGELLRFFVRAALRPWRTTGSRAGCAMWYDGKR